MFDDYARSRYYYELVGKIAHIHSVKNQDYAGVGGDPLSNFKRTQLFGVSPQDGVMTRLSDKFERVCNLYRKEKEGISPAVVQESLEDSLEDLANYALLLLCVRNDEQNAILTKNNDEDR